MKKPMKKFKRYQDGGDVEEASAKQRGLDMSNKEAPVGFFERLRMGNIDEPGTEAYNRFGAGRGRAAPTATPTATPAAPAAPAMPAASSRPLSDDMYSDYGPSEGRSSSETIKPTRPTATKPVVPAKPAASKPKPEQDRIAMPQGPMRGMRSDAGTSPPIATHFGPREEERSAASKIPGQSVKAPKGEKIDSSETSRNIENALLATGAGGVGLAGLYKMFKGGKKAVSAGRDLVTSPSKKPSYMGKADDAKAAKAREKLSKSSFIKKSGDDVTDVTAKKRGGAVKKYASGGMVSSASRRADGIATKGKTRGKIC